MTQQAPGVYQSMQWSNKNTQEIKKKDIMIYYLSHNVTSIRYIRMLETLSYTCWNKYFLYRVSEILSYSVHNVKAK